ncbi:sugar MFS transporter [Streptococcus merionis]|uniref:MFS transporter n=1 Tax=Streptococcus merionis TaxID=400065 RepID=UPI0026EFBE4D|nr:MFS transporter [Streptococcus merionis]
MFQILLVMIYLAFISLGLPDGLLGAAWPAMRVQMNLPMSYMGIISMIISVGTIVSSLQSHRLMLRFGTGKVTAVSVGMTALALFGFSVSSNLIWLCFFAIPYGLGAGSVDAALNNYVALHYSSKHMSWLHCMWGIGASIGPYIMSFALTRPSGWPLGYLLVGIIQVILTAMLFMTLSLWQHDETHEIPAEEPKKALTLKQILSISGAKEIMVCFFCYCALESTAGLWAASYLIGVRSLSDAQAASFASLFYVGITVGRAINGFLAMRFSDSQLIRLGQVLIGLGVAVLFLPVNHAAAALLGLLLIGLGCAPIYPCIIHSTPDHFGKENSQAIIGVQMASAYLGTTLMPPLFGLLGNGIGLFLFPVYLALILIGMVALHERLMKVHVEMD